MFKILSFSYILIVLDLADGARNRDAENRFIIQSGRIFGEFLYILTVFPAIDNILFRDNIIGSLKLHVYTDENNKFCPEFSEIYNKTFNGRTRIFTSDLTDDIRDIMYELKGDDFVVVKDLISNEMTEEENALNFLSTYTMTFLYDDKFKFTHRKFMRFQSGNKVSYISGLAGRGIVKYAEIDSLNVKTIEMRAAGGIYTYFMIIPNNPNGILDLLNELRNPLLLEDMLRQGKEICARVTVPNGDFYVKVDLGTSVRESRFSSEVFYEGGLGLCGVTENSEETYISSILHGIHLKAGPLNANASADARCPVFNLQMDVNTPHLLYITYTENLLPIRMPLVGLVFV